METAMGYLQNTCNIFAAS